jgi:hypothetical protein
LLFEDLIFFFDFLAINPVFSSDTSSLAIFSVASLFPPA